MRTTKSRFVILIGTTSVLILFFTITFYIANRPTEQELRAEQIIHLYLEEKGLNNKPRTDEYKSIMRGILLGELPELTEVGRGYVSSQEELDYVLRYAWVHSGYKELYGRYEEPDTIEAKLPTSTEPATETGEEIIATAMVALLDGQIYTIDGCVWVKNEKHETNYILVWPPDTSVNIDDQQIIIRTGIVRDKIEETVLQNGDWVLISGGETSNLSNELFETIPPHCIGPYWVVGFSVEKLQSPNQ